MIKRQNGVTLLALVITIIIIIILATITMNMAFGDNGLVEKAEQAKNMTEEAGKKEQEQLANTVAYLNEIIYGDGGEQNQNGEEGENTVDSNEIGTNTIEPPPVEEIPDGDEEGAIIFGEPIWSEGKASITIETETEYQIEYKVNEGEWTNLNISSEGINKGKVEGLNHNDIVYARLTDGADVGEYTSITVVDTVVPERATINLSKTEAIAGETITAKVTHADNESGVDVGKSKWVFNTIATSVGTEEGSYTGTFKSNGETISIETESVGTYYLHVLTVDKAGNRTETISDAVIIKEIKGSITCSTPSWSGGEAVVELSTTETNYTIEYKINDESWTALTNAGVEGNTGTKGKITGLHHGDKITTRLTNGDQTGEEVSFKIEDKIAPQVEVTAEGKDTSALTVNVEVADNESGLVDNVTYTYYIKKSSEPNSSYVQKESNTANTYTFTGLEQGTSYDIKVEVAGDKAGNKGTGTLSGQTTNTLPGGGDSTENGAIAFGNVSWSKEKASISISTNTNYKIQYQVNGTNEGSWKNINNGEKVTWLSHDDTVYGRLADGTNYGEPSSTTVTDEINPTKAIINLSTTSAIVGQTITADVTHTDNESGVDITKSKWVFNTTATNIGTEEGRYTGTFTANSETINIPTSSIGTYYLHVLTVDKAGNKTETISEAVTLQEIKGSITCSTPKWSAGEAKVTLSTTETNYTIEYKINDGSWMALEDAVGGNTGTNGKITGLHHGDKITARLTNGEQTGEEVSFEVKDETEPQVVVTAPSKDTSKITVNVETKDNESGMSDSITYTYYIKKTSESDYVQKASNSTNTYTFTGLEQGTSYDIKVEAVGDKAGNKGTGLLSGQTTSSLPGGETGVEEGVISFGTVTWSNGLAETSISTNTSYSIEYQVAAGLPIDGSWKAIANNGNVTGINNNDTVYARLTDGVNYGEYASITIKDTGIPAKATINLNKTTAIAGEAITAKVTHTDNESGVDIAKSKWVFNTTQGNIGTDEGSYTGTFASNGETIKIPTSSTGTYYLHVLTTDKAGNKAETVSEAVTLEKVTGSINKEGETTWSNETASIVVSTEEKDYTIEYKINDGEWVRLEEAPGEEENTGTRGIIPGLKDGDKVYTRLTNGEQTGDEIIFDVEDEIPPKVTVTPSKRDTSTLTINAAARDDESGMASTVTYTYYIKKSSDPESAYAEKASNSTNTYTFTKLEQGTNYDIKVEVQGDKAGNKGTGLLTNQRTETLPGGEESTENGAISFGSPSWSNGVASIVITTNTNYTIEYQVNSTGTQGWKKVSNGGKVTGLSHNDTVYARLTDGTNYGEPASTTVTDEINPIKATINLNKTTAIAGETITADVTHTDNESGVDIARSKWVFNTSSMNIGTDEGRYTGTFTENGETINIPTSSIGTYYLHVLTVDKAGNKTETISKAVTLEEIKGSITCSTPKWSAGEAEVTLSTTETNYKIEYKINDGSWTALEDTGTNEKITGLHHGDTIYARLTNGEQTGKEVNFAIKDTISPRIEIIVPSKDTSQITVNVQATDNESGMTDEVKYTYYIKKSSEGENSYVQKASNNNSNYTFTGLQQNTSYDIKAEVIGDKAGNKGINTITGQITNKLPGGDAGLEQGAINFGTVTWGGGTASVQVSTNTSYVIEYQKAQGEPADSNWQTIQNNGKITGIAHNETVYARLTDGVNYGEYASVTIKDTVKPSVEISQGEITDKSITVNVSASDNQTGLMAENTYKYYLNNELKQTTTEMTYIFTGLTEETAYDIKVEAYDKAGNVGSQSVSISTIEKSEPINAETISKSPEMYYGAEVKGYECKSDGVSKWRIYYADETNIYLIADDYITAANAPKGQGGSEITSIGTYGVNLESIVNDYSGASWINENSKAKKWLGKYLSINGSSTNNNIKEVAYMLDTNVWNIYAGEYAEYAIGGPTIELFCKSYNNIYRAQYEKWIECDSVNSNGYQLQNESSEYDNYVTVFLMSDQSNNGIYMKESNSDVDKMIFASPAANDAKSLICHSKIGILGNGVYSGNTPGLRPIVCLKNDVQLEKQSDEIYEIIK